MEMYAPAKTKDGNQGWSYLLHIGKKCSMNEMAIL
jgi:hypothetical protein